MKWIYRFIMPSQTELASAAPEIRALLGAQIARLSPQLRRAARFLAKHPESVAIHSLRGLAAKADVTPATFVRLAQALGFDGFPELKRELVGRLMPAALS